MALGGMIYRVAFYYIGYQKDAGGGQGSTPRLYKTLWADVSYIRRNTEQIGEGEKARERIKVRVRYDSGIKDSMFIYFDGLRYSIVELLPVPGKPTTNAYWNIVAERIGEEGVT